MVRSLYIHIPFCERKCRYCDFYSVPFSETSAESYVHALCGELAMRRGHAGLIETVYIGGGTPTILSCTCMAEIMDSVLHHHEMAADVEITVEANPGTLTAEMLGHLRQRGVNRLSIGVQSLRDSDLWILGRTHSASEAKEAVQAAKDAGFLNLSIDLIYAIPGQTPESWEDVLAEALDLKPHHLSAYELTVEEGTPLHEAVRRGELIMPDEESVAAMYLKTAELTAACGFRQYEISNYSRPGRECRHNLNYWRRGEYLGAGAGAHSFVGVVRSANLRDLTQYVECIGAQRLPVTESQKIGEKEELVERVFLALRTAEGIDGRLLPDNAWTTMNKAAEEMVSCGLAELRQNRLRLTRRGFLLSNEVIARLLSAR